MATNVKCPTSRRPNSVVARTETVTSADGQRRVTFRNAKRSIGNHRFDVVRVAQLKTLVDGKWKVIASGRSVENGQAFLNGEDA